MFLVGLTGGIASGKSSVAQMLITLGCPLIDADLLAREGTFCNLSQHILSAEERAKLEVYIILCSC